LAIRFVARHHYNDVSTSAGSTAAPEVYQTVQSLSNTNNTTNQRDDMNLKTAPLAPPQQSLLRRQSPTAMRANAVASGQLTSSIGRPFDAEPVFPPGRHKKKLNPHPRAGTSSLSNTGELLPWLAAEIPTVENGALLKT
jgi:hypothetical protein